MEQLYSKILGQGKPLIILHGFLGMSDNWKTLGNQYAQNGFEVHLIDQRNHGRSFHSDAFSYELMVEDLHRYCREHQLNQIDLIGHSMGGKTAMLFATTYPEMVEKLIVADISPKYYPVHHQTILNGLLSIDFNVTKSRKEADEQLSRYIPELGIRQFLLKNIYWKDKEELAFRFNLTALNDNIEEVGKALPEDAVFNKETLFVKGGKSEYITPQDEPLIKKHFPEAAVSTIDNAGHWVQAESPKMFFETTLQFLKC
ncbi:alpha/beta fold hydrolase [Sinomicrobium weinanense]|uniref:Alpha/beta fold hydrolase n=1 Tax=Sinomicrobium weinanense TaxID=2842200 RepID=A0A926JV66_9FLAO|nr:alpha/beta fold hydrolase [Sinomicrobium weinanense]MBC9797959.1 alpha/beta fold hydrolase [Sinomicrobium weinanense]MBU3123105.1 alpha/beta fold hydrolase [Sinomicrobium weinanense]